MKEGKHSEAFKIKTIALIIVFLLHLSLLLLIFWNQSSPGFGLSA